MAFVAVLALSAPALATVAEGVRRWQAGDYAGAVRAWQTPAAQGDANALFNLAQAYRLGRGVPRNVPLAEDHYRRAAQRGHVAATANLGISLFQDGRKGEAMGFLRTAADRGDARAAYVLGTAIFNGDGAARNQVLGLAYMIRSRDLGLAQAGPQVTRMGAMVGPPGRARAEAAAAALAAGEPLPVDLTGMAGLPGAVPAAPVQAAAAAPPAPAAAAPQAQPVASPPDAAPQAQPPAPPAAATAPPAASPAGAPAAAATPAPVGSRWLVQLGAYSSERAARLAWATLVSQAAELVEGHSPVYASGGRLVRLQVGPFAARDAARDFCQRLAATGRPCFVAAG